MFNVQIISSIIGVFVGLGTLIAGIGFAYAQFVSGGGKAKDDLIATLKETATVEKDRATRLAAERITLVTSHQDQLNELSGRIGKLQGLYEASEENKKEYLAILQGRDPAQKVFMEMMTKSVEDTTRFRTDTVAVLGEIRTFMEKLNKNSIQNTTFLHDVDNATAKETGNILRKES